MKQALKNFRWIAPLLLAIIVLLTFSKILFHENYVLLDAPDLTEQAYPSFHAVSHWFQNKKLLLWNPYIQSGRPNAGEALTGLFYPAYWFFYLWPSANGQIQTGPMETLILLNFWLMCLFAYFLARSLGISRMSSVLAGVVFAFGGLNSKMQSWGNIQSSLVWLPLVLMFYRKAQLQTDRKEGLANLLLAAFCLALSFLAGHHQPSIQAVILIALYSVYARISGQSKRGGVGLLAGLIIIVAGAVMLAAVQIIPSLEWGLHAYRWGGAIKPIPGSEKIPYYLLENTEPVSPQDILSLVLPYASTRVNLYVGPAVILLALIGGIFHRKTDARFYLLAGFLLLFLSWGKFSILHTWLYTFVPGVWFAREAIFFLTGFVLCIALLAGYGLDTLCGNNQETEKEAVRKFVRRSIELIALMVAVLFVSSAVAVIQDIRSLDGFALERAGRLILYLVLTGTFLIFFYNRRISSTIIQILFLSVVVIDLGSEVSASIPQKIRDSRETQTPENVYLPTELVETLQGFQEKELTRVDDLAEVLPPNAGEVWFIHSTSGYRPTMYQEYFIFRNMGWGALSNVTALLNARYYLSPIQLSNPYKVWENEQSGIYFNPRAVPRVFIPQNIRLFSRRDQMLEFMSTPLFNPGKTAVFWEDDWRKLPDRWKKILNPESVQIDLSHLVYEKNPLTRSITSTNTGAKQRLEFFDEPWGWRPGDRLATQFIVETPANVFALFNYFPGSESCTLKFHVSGKNWKKEENIEFPADELQVSKIREVDLGFLDRGNNKLELEVPEGCSSKLDSIELFSRKSISQSGTGLKVVSYEPDRVVIETDLEKSSLLVLSEIFYPGWIVKIDQSPASVLRVDFLLRAVTVDAGKHKIEFEFRPVSVYLGMLISGISLLALLSYITVIRKGKNKPGQ